MLYLCLCRQTGKDVVDVVKCNVSKCGKYYHERCLLQQENPQYFPGFARLCTDSPSPIPIPIPTSAAPVPAPVSMATVVNSNNNNSSSTTSSRSASKKQKQKRTDENEDKDKDEDGMKMDIPADAPSEVEAVKNTTDNADNTDITVSRAGKDEPELRYLHTTINKKTKKTLPYVVCGVVQNSLHGNNCTDAILKLTLEQREIFYRSNNNTDDGKKGSYALPPQWPTIRDSPSWGAVGEALSKFTDEEVLDGIRVTSLAIASDRQVESFTFRCPQHDCRVCSDYYHGVGKSAKKASDKFNNELFPCVECPIAYHINCMPAGTRYNVVCLLCVNHPNVPLPAREAQTFKSAIYEQMTLPEEAPNKDDVERKNITTGNHFVLPLPIRDEIRNISAPREFKKINRLDYTALGSRGEKDLPHLQETSEEEGGSCACKKDSGCGEDCHNRIMKLECTNICKSSKKQEGNCGAGPGCGNRNFQSRTWSKTVRFKEHAMGFGLKAGEDIAEGALVMEYIGEVIHEEEMQKRMSDQRQFSPNDHDFYIMELQAGIYVDGKKKGSDSRFINHSCEPNCELDRWVVNGKMRIGIFAIKNIPKNTPLCYDYQFDTNEISAFKCFCGADTCRGTMAPKNAQERALQMGDKSLLSDRQRKKYMKQGQMKEAALKGGSESEGALKRSCTSDTLPGDALRPLKEGPHKATFQSALDGNVFLVRNVMVGNRAGVGNHNASSYWSKRRHDHHVTAYTDDVRFKVAKLEQDKDKGKDKNRQEQEQVEKEKKEN